MLHPCWSRLCSLHIWYVATDLEKVMASQSSTLAWKIPWMEEPGRLQSMGSLRVGHDWATSLYFSLSCIGEDNGNPLQCSCLENTRDGGAWWAAVSGVAQSRTWLKRRSSSSSSSSHWSGECILFHPLSERRIRSGLYKCGLDHSTIYVII